MEVNSLLHMPFFALKVDFHQSDTMKSEIELSTYTCHDVCVEPELQTITNEILSGASCNSQDGARLDIAANGICGGSFERTYFDVRVFDPYSLLNAVFLL